MTIENYRSAIFKAGDYIINNNRVIYQIKSVLYSKYNIFDKGLIPINEIDKEFHLWNITNAKKGDIISSNVSISIFNQLHISGNELFETFAEYNKVEETLDITKNGNIKYSKFYHPASEEEKQLLFKKLKEKGYFLESNGEVEKIPPKAAKEIIEEIDIDEEIKKLKDNIQSNKSVDTYISGVKEGMKYMKTLLLTEIN